MTRKRTQEEAENKTKTKHWWENSENPSINKRSEYLEKLNRKECNVIIKTRTSMLPVKMNQKNKFQKNTTCRYCKSSPETQKHIIEECKEPPWANEAIKYIFFPKQRCARIEDHGKSDNTNRREYWNSQWRSNSMSSTWWATRISGRMQHNNNKPCTELLMIRKKIPNPFTNTCFSLLESQSFSCCVSVEVYNRDSFINNVFSSSCSAVLWVMVVLC